MYSRPNRRAVTPILVVLIVLLLAFTDPVSKISQIPRARAVSNACTQRLQNGTFETGNIAPWVETTSGAPTLLSQLVTRSESGSQWAVWMGGQNDANDDLYQQVTIPSNIASAELAFWWTIQSQEEGPASDFLTVTVRDGAGNVLATLQTLSNEDESATLTWTQTSHSLAAYAGQTVRIGFRATTDVSEVTSFFIDDVSLVVCESAATPTRTREQFVPLLINKR